MSELTLENFPRKFVIGEWVKTESGTKAQVIGSALYGTDGKRPTQHTFVEYRLRTLNAKRTFYRHEWKLEPVN